jgi:hypothetical protein
MGAINHPNGRFNIGLPTLYIGESTARFKMINSRKKKVMGNANRAVDTLPINHLKKIPFGKLTYTMFNG